MIDPHLIQLKDICSACEAVLFDMDDVLCHLDDTKRIQYLHDLSGMPHDDIAYAIWGSGFEDRTDAGEFTAEEYLVEFGQRIGYPISRRQWCEYRKSGMTPIPEMLAFAAGLKDSHKIGILTNNGLLLVEEIDFLFPELRDIFGDNIFCSAQFGFRKPDPAVYIAACGELGTITSATLFIDDRHQNVEGARSAGMFAYHFLV
ncbi:MAG: HAD family phosphatase [Armatimonadetes bacterium]|nr:HAD family phosphatase [Armatimonadota bacterium]